MSGINKRPVEGPVSVRAPGPKGAAGSGLAGDAVCDRKNHGGDDQAVYAYAREDLDVWQEILRRPLAPGVTKLAVPGAYLRVVEPGSVEAGDQIEVVDKPHHEITVGLMFRALTLERDLRPRLIEASGYLPGDLW